MATVAWIGILLFKLILYILLSVLAIVLFLFLIVWLVPLKYSIDSKYKNSLDSLYVSGRVKWMGKLLYLEASFEDGTYKQIMRFFGKDLGKLLKKEEVGTEEVIHKTLIDSADLESATKSLDELEEEKEKVIECLDKDVKKKGMIYTIKSKIKLEKIHKSFKKIKWNFGRIYDMIKRVWRLKDKIEIIFERPVHQRTLENLKQQGVYLWSKVKPKKIILQGDVGFEDPSITGKSMALLGLLFPFLGEYDIEVEPHFEDQIMVLAFSMSGKLYIRHLLIVLLKIVKDKRNRHTFKTIKRLKL